MCASLNLYHRQAGHARIEVPPRCTSPSRSPDSLPSFPSSFGETAGPLRRGSTNLIPSSVSLSRSTLHPTSTLTSMESMQLLLMTSSVNPLSFSSLPETLCFVSHPSSSFLRRDTSASRRNTSRGTLSASLSRPLVSSIPLTAGLRRLLDTAYVKHAQLS
jgi:hypothetical protein